MLRCGGGLVTGPSRRRHRPACAGCDHRGSCAHRIPHPGEPNSELSNPDDPRAVSTWPHANDHLNPQDPIFGRLRSACLVITKGAGGKVGT